jgi:hypothetical protein
MYMYNLKQYGGTFKGLAGECMCKVTIKDMYLTRFHPIEFVLRKLESALTPRKEAFIVENWLSFDGIQLENGQIVLYEVKTRNLERELQGRPFILTQNCLRMYTIAERMGFVVRIAKVVLLDDWNYTVSMHSLKDTLKKTWVERNGNYDKTKYCKKQ